MYLLTYFFNAACASQA